MKTIKNKTIAFKIVCVPHSTEEIWHVYKSKHNLKRKSQVMLLMITDGEKIISITYRNNINHVRDFFGSNCLHSYRTEDKLKKHKDICKNHDYRYVEMPKEDSIKTKP